jgi:hypothetical protein
MNYVFISLTCGGNIPYDTRGNESAFRLGPAMGHRSDSRLGVADGGPDQQTQQPLKRIGRPKSRRSARMQPRLAAT